MTNTPGSLPETELPPGAVHRLGRWVVGDLRLAVGKVVRRNGRATVE